MVDDEPPRVSEDLQTKKLLSQRGRGVFALFGLSFFVAVAAVAGAVCSSPRWQSAFAPIFAVAFEVSSGPGFVHRRPSCEPSGDPEYPCLLSRPPSAFDGEIAVYFSGEGEYLSVKIVVPGATRPGSGGSGGKGWAAVGFSPDGRMAGPSEADVGFIGEDGDLQGRAAAVLRYRMDGYSASSVVPLSECDQALRDGEVRYTDDGSLVVSFRRPWSAPLRPPMHQEQQCAADVKVTGGVEEGTEIAWLDPREDGVVVLWAYSQRGTWPSYHDANGAFFLPRMAGSGGLGAEAVVD